MEKQITEYASGNEMAAIAIRQIGYDLMGYYPITPSTQIAENLDVMRANGESDLIMIAAEGEHSAAGICYGAAVGGGRVINATSANGLLYAIEQFPVQSGTRYPMVMNVVCRTVSGPLSIKGDHSDIMFMLNAGWPILFAHSVQEVYDFNIISLKLAETVRLPVVVAYDGFFTSHQKRRCLRFERDEAVQSFIGPKKEDYPFLDLDHPITVGSYMNEPDLINNRYQLHLAMKKADTLLPELFREYGELSGRKYQKVEGYKWEDAETLLLLLGSSYDTAKEAVDQMRDQGKKVGVVTLHTLRPFPDREIVSLCKNAENLLVADRQDSYGAKGGNLSLEVRAAIQRAGSEKCGSSGQRIEAETSDNGTNSNNMYGSEVHIKNLVYGLGGKDFFVEDAVKMVTWAENPNSPDFAYYGVTKADSGKEKPAESFKGEAMAEGTNRFFAPLSAEKTQLGATKAEEKDGKVQISGGTLNATAAIPKRLAPGHGACPGCGIPVNVNLLLRAIENPVVLLFQTGCGMIVTTAYPRTSFKVPFVHNLFQNGAAALSGIAEICYRKQKKGEIPPGDIIFIMVSGDGGMDIGMGSALGTALRGHRLILFEYDNGGYMNTGYQLSYSTPKGARSATSHVGKEQYGKPFFHKDMPQIIAATGIPYVATVAESNPMDFIKKAAKAAYYAAATGTAYVKALSACPLNWNDKPAAERRVIEKAVDCCYFPLYEVEKGKTTLSYDPEKMGKKVPVLDWLSMMGRTKHLQKEAYADIVKELQEEVDRRFARLKARAENPIL
ncbi:thiamine pyrophosphate-dependent enzyme [Parablautia muri]|uniref:Pyruvate synthase n=1 Tax=Parablautia muri TaxID=2320879 RepID=A0A9X5BHE8_9FIRM|nr:thiamine pyrophosphate-dependent enzyme [Parablautia muri]NBJ93980.1 pyruvate synthase [Parablautia muri]